MYAAAFAATAQIHDDPPASPATRDPTDDLVALARSANAEVLASVDGDLLEADVGDVAVIRPAEFVARLAQ